MTPRPGLDGARARRALPAIAAGVVAVVTAAPWALGFSARHTAVAAHIAFAMGLGPIAILLVALPVAAVSTAVAGGWLVASPWALGYAATGWGAWSVDVLGGLALIALAVAALRCREQPPRVSEEPPRLSEQPLRDASAAAQGSGP